MEIIYEKKDKIATITINRPQVMNAMDTKTYKMLFESIDDFNNDDNSWVLIITGAGEKAFSSGIDLTSTIGELTGGSLKQLSLPRIWFKDIYKPIIAAVNGVCYGGAMEIFLATDLRIASENATFAIREIKLGLMPSCGDSVRLAHQISWCHAMEIQLLGDKITAQDAYRMGLVNRVVPLNQLMATAEGMARQICENGPLAVRGSKQAAVLSMNIPLDQALNLEFFMAERVYASADAKEGPMAFLEKRKPNYKGS